MALRIGFRGLEVFVAIADCATVTRAAELLAQTQSAASQALAALEQGLGASLFDRVGRRLVLNENGRLLLPKARAMLDLGMEAQNLLSGAAAHLRLGASTTIANYLLPPCIAGFRQLHVDAGVDLLVGNTQAIINAVAAFRVDVGFIEGPCHHPDLRITPWRDDELLVVVAATHDLATREASMAQLAQQAWIMRESGSGTREEADRLLLPRLGAFSVAMELGDSEAIKHVVAAGLGVSCLPRCVVAQQLQRGELHALPLPPLMRKLYRVMHRDKALTRGMERFLGFTAVQGTG
jgi:DNA-binding transcriptional LysR family regulator